MNKPIVAAWSVLGISIICIAIAVALYFTFKKKKPEKHTPAKGPLPAQRTSPPPSVCSNVSFTVPSTASSNCDQVCNTSANAPANTVKKSKGAIACGAEPHNSDGSCNCQGSKVFPWDTVGGEVTVDAPSPNAFCDAVCNSAKDAVTAAYPDATGAVAIRGGTFPNSANKCVCQVSSVVPFGEVTGVAAAVDVPINTVCEPTCNSQSQMQFTQSHEGVDPAVIAAMTGGTHLYSNFSNVNGPTPVCMCIPTNVGAPWGQSTQSPFLSSYAYGAYTS